LVHIGGDGRQLGHRRVQPQQPDGGVGEEIQRHIEQAGDKTLHAQGRASSLLEECLHRLTWILKALTLRTHLDGPPHEVDLHLDPDVVGLRIGNGRDRRDLPHLDTAKDDGRPDVQPLDGAIKEQDIGQFFLEEFAAAEEQCPGDQEDDSTDDKGANRSWIDPTSHAPSFLAPARPWRRALASRCGCGVTLAPPEEGANLRLW